MSRTPPLFRMLGILLAVTWIGCTPPMGEVCVPACREGYVCANKGCVSACNPVCAAGETCVVTNSVAACVRTDAGGPERDGGVDASVDAGDAAIVPLDVLDATLPVDVATDNGLMEAGMDAAVDAGTSGFGQPCGAAVPCSAGFFCRTGVCTCATATNSFCGTNLRDPSGCADLTSDPMHCGNCSNVCTSNQMCSGSSCIARPDAGTVDAGSDTGTTTDSGPQDGGVPYDPNSSVSCRYQHVVMAGTRCAGCRQTSSTFTRTNVPVYIDTAQGTLSNETSYTCTLPPGFPTPVPPDLRSGRTLHLDAVDLMALVHPLLPTAYALQCVAPNEYWNWNRQACPNSLVMCSFSASNLVANSNAVTVNIHATKSPPYDNTCPIDCSTDILDCTGNAIATIR